MNEEIFVEAHKHFVDRGYKGNLEQFKELLSNDKDVQAASHKYFSDKGYKGTENDFVNLLGLKKKEKSESQSPTETTISSSDTTQTAQAQPSDSSTDKTTPEAVSFTESQVSMRDPMESLGQAQAPTLDYREYKVQEETPSDLPVVEGISQKETDEEYFEETKKALQQSDEGLRSTAKFLEDSPVPKQLEADRQNLELSGIERLKIKSKIDSYPRNEDGELVPSSKEERAQMLADIDEYNARTEEVKAYADSYEQVLQTEETQEYLKTLDEFLVNSTERKLADEKDKKQYIEDAKEAYDETFDLIPEFVRSTVYNISGSLMQLPDMIAKSPQAMERAIFDLYNQGYNIAGGTRPSAYETLVKAGLYEPFFQGDERSELSKLGSDILQLNQLVRTGKKLENGYTMSDINKSFLEHIIDGDVRKGLDLMLYDVSDVVGQLAIAVALPEVAIPLLSATAAGSTYADAIEDPNISTAGAVTLGVSAGVAEYVLGTILNTDVKQAENIKRALSGKSLKEIKSKLFDGLRMSNLPKPIQGIAEEALEEGLAGVFNVASEISEANKRGEAREFNSEDAIKIFNDVILGGIGGGLPFMGKGVKNAHAFLATKWKNSQSVKNLRKEKDAIDKSLESVNKALSDAYSSGATEAEVEALESKKAELEVQLEEIDSGQMDFLSSMSEEDVKEYQENALKANALNRQAKEAKTDEGRKALEAQARELIEANDKITEKYDSKKEEGLPSNEREGETPEQGQPQQETSAEEVETSGVVQTEEIEVFRGTGNNVSDSENESTLWVAEDEEVAKNYAGRNEDGSLSVEKTSVKKPENPIELPYKLATEVRGSNIGGVLRQILAKGIKEGKIAKSKARAILDLISDFETKAGEELELFTTKINKSEAGEAFSKATQALGYDSILQKESASKDGEKTNTYGLFKNKYPSLTQQEVKEEGLSKQEDGADSTPQEKAKETAKAEEESAPDAEVTQQTAQEKESPEETLTQEQKDEFDRKKKINDFARKIVKDGKENLSFEEEQFYAENMEEVDAAIAEAQKEAPRDNSKNRNIATKVLAGKELSESDVSQYEKDPDAVEAAVNEAAEASSDKGAAAVAKEWIKDARSKRKANQVKMTDKQGRDERLRAMNDGARNAIRAQKDVVASVKEIIKNLRKKGRITVKQAEVLAKKAAQIQFNRPSSVTSFIKYAENLFEKADYNERVARARKRIKRAVRTANSSKFPASLGNLIAEINNVNPTSVDIDALESALESVEATLRKLKGNETDVDINRASKQELREAIMPLVEATNQVKLQAKAEDAGMSVTEFMDAAREDNRLLNSEWQKYKKENEGKSTEDALWSEFLEEKKEALNDKRSSLLDSVSSIIENVSVRMTSGVDYNLDDIDLNELGNTELIQLEYHVANYLKNGDKSNLGNLLEKAFAKTRAKESSELIKLRKGRARLSRLEGMIDFFFGKNQGAKFSAALSLVKYDMAVTKMKVNISLFSEEISNIIDTALSENGINLDSAENNFRILIKSLAKQPPVSVQQGIETMEDFYESLKENMRLTMEHFAESSSREDKKNYEAAKKVYEEIKDVEDLSKVYSSSSKLDKWISSILTSIEDWHETHADQFIESEIAYNNNEIRKVPFYTAIPTRRAYSKNNKDSAEKLMDDMANNANKVFNQIVPPKNRTASKERNESAYVFKDGTYYSPTFINAQLNSFAASENQIRLMPVAIGQSTFLSSKYIDPSKPQSIFRDKKTGKRDSRNDRDYEKIKQEVQDRYVRDQAIKNEYLNGSPILRSIERTTGALRNINYVTALGGIQQVLRQSPVFASSIIKIAFKNIGKGGNLDVMAQMMDTAARELYSSVKGVVDISEINENSNPLIRKYSVAIRDLETAILSAYNPKQTSLRTGDKRSNKAYRKADDFIKSSRDLWMLPLTSVDRAVARASFLAFYSSYMKSKGSQDVTSDDFWNEQAENPNEEAVAYALEETQRDHNSSLRETLNSHLKRKNALERIIANVFLPFASFQINKKNSMYDDTRRITNSMVQIRSALKRGDKKTAELLTQDLKDGLVSYAGHLAEGALYSTAVAYVGDMFGLWALMAGIIVGEDDKEEYEQFISEAMNDVYKDKLFNTTLLKTGTPIPTNQGESAMIYMLEYLHYLSEKEEGESMKDWKMAGKNNFVSFSKISDREQRMEGEVSSLLSDLGLYGVSGKRFFDAMVDIKNASNNEVITSSGVVKQINDRQAQSMYMGAFIQSLNAVGLIGAEGYKVSSETKRVITNTARDTKISAWLKAQKLGEEYQDLGEILVEIIKDNPLTATDRIKREFKDAAYREYVMPAVTKGEISMYKRIDKQSSNKAKYRRLVEDAESTGRDPDTILAQYVLYRISKTGKAPTEFIKFYNLENNKNKGASGSDKVVDND